MSQAMGGVTGRFLRVDLTAGSVSLFETPDVETWLGARGWNALLAWRELARGTGPFDPANTLTLSAGPLVGTGAPTAGRVVWSTIGPRGYPQPRWTSASMGGYLGAELKYAGYDGLVVVGQANAPCYLLIEDDRVTLRDAADLWGRGTFDTQQTLKDRHSRQHQIAAIGPAGENRVRFASVIHRLSNAVGNGGFGGVMGSKNLKAICIRGTRGVPIADPAGFLTEVQRVWRLGRGGIGGVGQTQQGYPVVACTHGCTMNCFMRIVPTPQETVDAGPLRMLKCVNTSFSSGSHPAYHGTRADGVTLNVPKPPGLGKAGLDLGNLAEDMGMTAWFYDSWYRWLGGLAELGIHDLDGVPVRLDDPAWWRDFISDTAHRRGIGNDVAEGLARFYDQHEIGPRHLAEFIEDPGSRGHGWHREGRAMEPHPSPFWEHSALLYAVSTRDVTPSTHGFFFLNDMYGYLKGETAPSESLVATMQGIAERLYGSREAILPGMEGIEKTAVWHQHRAVIKDSLGLCDWAFPMIKRTFETREALRAALDEGVDAIWGDPGAEAALFRACTGINMDIHTMERPTAERIVTLERCLDARLHGRSRVEDEMVISHYQWPEKTDGTHLTESADEFRALLERYYDERGWDRTSGQPTAETLMALGLLEMA